MILPRDFYDRPALDVAEALLGKFLCRRIGRRVLAGRIVETEAYVGPEDRACHAWHGETARTRPMFGPPGHAYVFLVYGMHNLFNAVCERAGHPAAVLVRALEPADGLEGRAATDGPGKLAAALRITTRHSGEDLVGGERLWPTIWIEDRGGPRVAAVATPRIGVDYAGEWAARPWRLVDPSSEWLSKRLAPVPVTAPRRAPPRRASR